MQPCIHTGRKSTGWFRKGKLGSAQLTISVLRNVANNVITDWIYFSFTMQEKHAICILLDTSRLSEIREHGVSVL
jgi:hypothetical protein